jgi:Ca2+/Na+ antiporter
MARRFNWRLFSCVAVFVFTGSFAIAVCQSDTALLLYLLVAGPILLVLTLVLLVSAAKGKYPRMLLLTLATAWVVVFSSFEYHRQIRTVVRWALWSGQFKNMLAQQSSLNGELKHVEWDGWGWAGMDTTVYLVFDPTDSLSMSAPPDQPRKSGGLRCAVADVTRLERDWYAVTFYTNSEWNS